MSRSRRKNPVSGYSGANSDKYFKHRVNRGLRRSVHMALHRMNNFDSYILPVKNDIANEWDSAKDGMCRWTLRDELSIKYSHSLGGLAKPGLSEAIDWYKRYYWK